MHRYSVDMFSYSGPLGILGSDRYRIPLKPVLGGVKIVALFISSHKGARPCCKNGKTYAFSTLISLTNHIF